MIRGRDVSKKEIPLSPWDRMLCICFGGIVILDLFSLILL